MAINHKYSLTENFLSKIIPLLISLSLFTFLNSCVLEVTVSPEEVSPPSASLIITSDPSNAEIFVNGKNSGKKTPDTLRYISEKELNIILKLPFFRDSSFSVSINKDEANSISVDFLSNPSMLGTLFFTSDPLGAQIFLNDSALGKSTVAQLKNVVPGIYSVRYKLTNFRDAQFSVYVRSSVTTTASYKLRDTLTWIDFQSFNSDLQSDYLSCIAVDDNNTKWIGTLNSGIISYDETSFTNYNKINSPLPDNSVLSVKVDNANRKWIGTSGGLAVLDNGSWQIFTSSNSGLPNNRINSVVIDNQNVKWLGTPSGIVRFDEQSWILYDTVYYDAVLGSPIILNANDILIDNNSLFWIASDVSGIATFKKPYFTGVFNTSNSCIPTNRTNHAALFNNEVWITHNPELGKPAGISILTSSSCKKLMIGSSSIVLNNIFIDNRNNKWICSNEGLFRIINQNVVASYSRTNSYLSSNNVTGIIMDKNGNYWVTTNGGGLNKLKI